MDIAEHFPKQEPLHEDLAKFLVDEHLHCLKHPLVYGVPYFAVMNAHYNACYQAKCAALKKATAEKNWSQYIFLHERPYRFQSFFEIQKDLSNKEYWTLLGHIWIDTENLWQVRKLAKILINSQRPGREYLMDEDEQKLLADLPEEFVIYRGHQKLNSKGFSWTLSYGKARWFARRFELENARVSVALCQKKDVIAVFLGRGEMEVIIDHDNLKSTTFREPKYPKNVKEILALAKSEFKLKNSDHGPDHWGKVFQNTNLLCDKVPEADCLVCQLFAVLHDCKRENEHDDPDHGLRAGQFVEQLSLPITSFQKKVLITACEQHNKGNITNDPTIGVCWDADRLDLPRVAIIPEPNLLSTSVAKTMIWRV